MSDLETAERMLAEALQAAEDLIIGMDCLTALNKRPHLRKQFAELAAEQMQLVNTGRTKLLTLICETRGLETGWPLAEKKLKKYTAS